MTRRENAARGGQLCPGNLTAIQSLAGYSFPRENLKKGQARRQG